jgi:hypothetical protein
MEMYATSLEFIKAVKAYAANRAEEFGKTPGRLFETEKGNPRCLHEEFTTLELMPPEKSDQVLPMFVGLMLFLSRHDIVPNRDQLIEVLSYSLAFLDVETFEVMTALCMLSAGEWKRLLSLNLHHIVCDDTPADDVPGGPSHSLLDRHAYFAPRSGIPIQYDDPWLVAAIIRLTAEGSPTTALAYATLLRMMPNLWIIAERIDTGAITLDRLQQTLWRTWYMAARRAAGLLPPDDETVPKSLRPGA